MSDKAFPSEFTAETAPAAGTYLFGGAGKISLATLLSSASYVAQTIASGVLLNPLTPVGHGEIILPTHGFVRVTADFYTALSAQTAVSIRPVYTDAGFHLVPSDYGGAGIVTINGVADIAVIPAGLNILIGDGANAWTCLPATNLTAVMAAIDAAQSDADAALSAAGAAQTTANNAYSGLSGKVDVAGHTALSIPASTAGTLADVAASSNDTLFGRVAGAFGFFNVTLSMIAAAVKSAAQNVESLRQIYTSTPAPIGTAAAGSSVQAAAGDHVHAHGSQTDGSHHAAATTSVAGFMSAADKTLVDAITSTSVTSPRFLASADGSASDPAFRMSDANSGTYWDATKGVVTAVNGADRLTVRADSRVAVLSQADGQFGAFQIQTTTGSTVFYAHNVAPEGVASANVGAVFVDATAGRIYVKRTGSGNTGWVLHERCESGTWTPTYTAVTNLDAVTGSTGIYLRVGDTVHFSFRINVDPTAASQCTARVSLPVASNFTSTDDALGTTASAAGAFPGRVFADTTNDALDFLVNTSGTTAQNIVVTGSYRVLP